MPHIIVELDRATAESGDLRKLAETLHNTLAAQETVKKASIKTRIQIAEASVIGEEERVGFLAVAVKLLPGRDDALKAVMAEAMLTAAKAFAPSETALSAEVVDLQVYRKP